MDPSVSPMPAADSRKPREMASLDTALKLVECLARRDFASMGQLLSAEVTLRCLTPRRVIEKQGREETIAQLHKWFGEVDEFQVLRVSVDSLADDRARLAYRFRLRPQPITGDERWHVIEQQLWIPRSKGPLDAINLLCSGFVPE